MSSLVTMRRHSMGTLKPAKALCHKREFADENILNDKCSPNRRSSLNMFPLSSGEMQPEIASMPSQNGFKKSGQYERKLSFTIFSNGIILSDQQVPIKSSGDRLRLFRRRRSSVTSQVCILSVTSSLEAPVYTALMLGSNGVGKTALMRRFTASAVTGVEGKDDDYQKIVPILLDEKEFAIKFIDVPAEDDHYDYKDVDAYIIVYSITDIDSVQYAEDLLQEITARKSDDAALILVANKTDLVRSRIISMEEGKSMASDFSCKFIEVSATANHRIDELLVGIVSQINSKPKRTANERRKSLLGRTGAYGEPGCMQKLKAARGLLNKVFKTSKSCDNLLVL